MLFRASITQVPKDKKRAFLANAALDEYQDAVPLVRVVNAMTNAAGSCPFTWVRTQGSKATSFVRWTLCEKSSSEDGVQPLLVSHVGVIGYCASRPHGTYIRDNNQVPPEYPKSGLDYTLSHTCKQHWAFQSESDDTLSFGALMSELESTLEGPITSSVRNPPSYLSMRKEWNKPGAFDLYHVQHPLVGPKYIYDRRKAYFDEDRHPHEWIRDAIAGQSTTGDQLVVLPGRPQVFVKRGLHEESTSKFVNPTFDEDWHRHNDIAVVLGQIHCDILKPSTQNPNRGVQWSCDWWPDSVMRIAKLVVEPENEIDERTFSTSIALSPRKRRRFNPNGDDDSSGLSTDKLPSATSSQLSAQAGPGPSTTSGHHRRSHKPRT